jgi:translation initiation factor IF-2
VAKKVKIYEIARQVGIESSELVEICQRAGYEEITHHSKAVEPEQAEEIRKAAIRLYKPKTAPAVKPAPPRKKTKEAPSVPAAADVKPVAPPRPMGTRQTEAAPPEAAAPTAPPRPKGEKEQKPRKRGGERKEDKQEPIRKRTIVFKQRRRPVARKQIDKLELEGPQTVRDLSEQMGVPANEIIRELMFEHGVRANINQVVDEDTIQLLGVSHEIEITFKEPKSAEDILIESLPEDGAEDLHPRPPVIALLGHVDHGKTSILDRIRNTRVAEGEAGGITQDIGAWQTEVEGHTLTFVDTPGHEAFTAMRARGAQVTDIVVLVVAADDGVMPQTSEAINHAQAAEVPIVIALNKVDKPDSNVMRVKQQLAGQGLNPEDWGGDVGCVEVSALQNIAIEDLLERIILESELLELQANPNRQARGAVLEARMRPGLGVVANLIVQNGTLRVGDAIVCGDAYGTVRSLKSDLGEDVDAALPSQPVALSGLSKVPAAGDTFLVVDSVDVARRIAEEREARAQKERRRPRRRVSLEDIYERLASGETKHLNVVLKADVQGTLEPLLNSLGRLGDDEVSVRIVHSGIGSVNQSDVELADAADAVIIAFRVSISEDVRDAAAERGLEIVSYDVIYNVTDEIRAALEGLLEPELREQRIGLAEIRQLFRISRYGVIAGCIVSEGSIRRSGRVRVIREGEVLHQGTLASLRQEKNDVREVDAGRECGMNIEGFNDLQPGDQIECFEIVSVKRKLSARPRKETVESASGAAGPAEQ